MAQKLRIIVGGIVGQYPLGGVAWDYFHYLLALSELGHDVYYHEDTWVWPLDPVNGYATDDASYTARFIDTFFANHGPHLRDKWHYVLLHDKGYGMSNEAFAEVARTADVYLNVSGVCFFPEDLSPRCKKVFIDTDPGYNQVMIRDRPDWSENIDRWVDQVLEHDVHLTYAENMFQPDCLVPRVGIDWKPTRCVATLPSWASVRQTPIAPDAPFSTVMTWRYFDGPIMNDGIEYHGKSPEHEKFRDMPKCVDHPLLLAVAGNKYDPEAIKADGWRFEPAGPASLTPERYMDFIARSCGEWSVAKNVYVGLRTGWFSCRTACYLAAGRPAVVQDTGWSRTLPTGEGLFAFETKQQAIDGINQILADPARHRAAAYDVAREYLAPDKTMPQMIESIYAGKGERVLPVSGGEEPPRREGDAKEDAKKNLGGG